MEKQECGEVQRRNGVVVSTTLFFLFSTQAGLPYDPGSQDSDRDRDEAMLCTVITANS